MKEADETVDELAQRRVVVSAAGALPVVVARAPGKT
jgi:hypothetical protein